MKSGLPIRVNHTEGSIKGDKIDQAEHEDDELVGGL